MRQCQKEEDLVAALEKDKRGHSKGSLHVLTKDRDVARQLDWGALISTADARAYLEPLGFELREKQALSQVVPLPIETPLQRQRHQENEILRMIKALGYDSKRLPKAEAGKPGVKAEVRKELDLGSRKFR